MWTTPINSFGTAPLDVIASIDCRINHSLLLAVYVRREGQRRGESSLYTPFANQCFTRKSLILRVNGFDSPHAPYGVPRAVCETLQEVPVRPHVGSYVEVSSRTSRSTKGKWGDIRSILDYATTSSYTRICRLRCFLIVETIFRAQILQQPHFGLRFLCWLFLKLILRFGNDRFVKGITDRPLSIQKMNQFASC